MIMKISSSKQNFHHKKIIFPKYFFHSPKNSYFYRLFKNTETTKHINEPTNYIVGKIKNNLQRLLMIFSRAFSKINKRPDILTLVLYKQIQKK